MIAYWEPSMSTGVVLLDLQHQALILRMNELVEAMAGGKGHDQLPELLEFLAQYVDEHLADEERLMEQHGCIFAPTNKRQHIEFTRRVVELREGVARDGSSLKVLVEVARDLRSWFVNHIQGCDTKLAGYVPQRAA